MEQPVPPEISPRTPTKRAADDSSNDERSTPETETPGTEKDSPSLSPTKRQKSDYYDAMLLKSLILNSLQSSCPKPADNKKDVELSNLINIGSGSFSQVYRADIMRKSGHDAHERLFKIAIKVITTQSSASRMLREADILEKAAEMGKRQRTCIMPIISMFLGERAGFIGIVQPYIAHLPFECYYTQLDDNQVHGYMRSLLTAIQTVHTLGYVHRDIKPANFIYIPNYNSGYLIDFGLTEPIPTKSQNSSHASKVLRSGTSKLNVQRPALARQSSSGQLKKRSSPKRTIPNCKCHEHHDKLCIFCWSKPRERQERSGTPGYRSPEILQKSEEQGPPIDMWAAGCILIQILSGRAPFFPPKEEPQANESAPQPTPDEHHKNLDSDAVCFSDQLAFCGMPAMTEAMKELKHELQISKTAAESSDLNHQYTADYVTTVCKKLRSTCDPEHGDPNPDFSDVQYELLWRLLCPSYSKRIAATDAIELLQDCKEEPS